MTLLERRDDGGVTAFVAVVAVALVMVAGMAYDGGQVLAAHASARSDAAKAARAGAQEIDLDVLRATADLALNPAEAEAAALANLDDADTDGSASVEGNAVTVTVTVVQDMHILPLPDRTVTATEEASATEVVAGSLGEGSADP
jgi:Flp pilus assembly protein TadG